MGRSNLVQPWVTLQDKRRANLIMKVTEVEKAYCPEGKFLFYNIIKINILAHISLEQYSTSTVATSMRSYGSYIK